MDIVLLELAGFRAALAAAGGLALWLAMTSRSTLLTTLAVALSIAAQLPGIVAHTQFQWGWLFANGLPFSQEPNILVVGLALAAAPAAIYGLGTAAALERVGNTLEAGNAEREEIPAFYRGNTLLLIGVMAFALAAGALALIPLAGIPGSLTESITRHPAVITWTGVLAFALMFGAAYSFFHRRWWARARDLAQDEGPGPASQTY